MTRKLIALAAALCMVLTLLAGCGNTETASTSGGAPAQTQAADNQAAADKTDAAAPAADQAPAPEDEEEDEDEEDIADVNVMFWTLNTIPADIEMVEDAINEIIEPRIHANIHLIITEMGSYINQVNLMMASNEKVDLMVTLPGGPAHFNSLTSQNQLMDITDLLQEYAQETLAIVPESWLKGTQIDGRQYSVTSYGDKATPLHFMVRTDYLNETGIDPATLTNANAIKELLLKIKENHPEITPMAPGSKKILTAPYMIAEDGSFVKYDGCGEGDNSILGIMDGDGDTFQNNYMRDTYKNTITVFKDWYDNDLVYKDGPMYDDVAQGLVASGVCASYFLMIGVGTESNQSTACQNDMTCIRLDESPELNTGSFRKFSWAVPNTATEPEAAVKLMNLFFTDAEVLNLLVWGIEGVHYQTLADGTIDFMDGEDPGSCGYYIGDETSILGNGFIAKVRKGQDPDLRAKTEAINLAASVSRYNGFSFNTDGLENEVSGLTNTVEEYRPFLGCGAFEWDYYDEFIKKMTDNGVDKYIGTVQGQLDAWLSAN